MGKRTPRKRLVGSLKAEVAKLKAEVAKLELEAVRLKPASARVASGGTVAVRPSVILLIDHLGQGAELRKWSMQKATEETLSPITANHPLVRGLKATVGQVQHWREIAEEHVIAPFKRLGVTILPSFYSDTLVFQVPLLDDGEPGVWQRTEFGLRVYGKATYDRIKAMLIAAAALYAAALSDVVLRGAVEIDWLSPIPGYNDLYGPAVAWASKLEKEAVYPRIVVGKLLYDAYLRSAPGEQHVAAIDCLDYISPDTDGRHADGRPIIDCLKDDTGGIDDVSDIEIRPVQTVKISG